MRQIQGTVTNLNGQSKISKLGKPYTIYDCVINGEAVSLGFQHPFAEGETVTINVDDTQYGVQMSKTQGVQPASTGVTQSAQPAPIPMKKATPQFPTQPGTKDVSIIRQNSLNHATKIVDDMIGHGVILAPKDMDAYIQTVIDTAGTLAQFSTGWRDIELAQLKQMEVA
jgi:hypothetical protein